MSLAPGSIPRLNYLFCVSSSHLGVECVSRTLPHWSPCLF